MSNEDVVELGIDECWAMLRIPKVRRPARNPSHLRWSLIRRSKGPHGRSGRPHADPRVGRPGHRVNGDMRQVRAELGEHHPWSGPPCQRRFLAQSSPKSFNEPPP
jgi:hypothetical protein